MTESSPPTPPPKPVESIEPVEPVEPVEPIEPIGQAPPPGPSPTTLPAPAPQPGRNGMAPGLALGAVLVVAGAILLVIQLIDFDIGALGWPLIIVAIGIGLMVIGLVGGTDSGLVVGGTVATAVGLLLAFQDATGLWATWAYAWALVGPAASGLGLALHGLRTGDRSDVRNGTWGLLGGLALFAIGFLFFEGIIGLSGFDVAIAEWVLPALVIGVGVVILGRALLQRGGEETTAG